MTTQALAAIRDLIQQDPNQRGLATDPVSNLLTVYPDDFANACRSLADTPNAAVAMVTGFFIPTGQPPAGETDGPLGALFLARALTPLGIRVTLVTDEFCRPALHAGLKACGLQDVVFALTLPMHNHPWDSFLANDWPPLRDVLRLTHLIALERVGPSHTPMSIERQSEGETQLRDFQQSVPEQYHDRCLTMRGIDITDRMSPAHLLFEEAAMTAGLTTIGIGDGGNEIGMGKIPWEVIRRNIPGGDKVACRVPTDHLIVAGVSNWGAYGLATGVWLMRGRLFPQEFCDVERERELLRIMVEHGPLVDGVTGRPTVSVDGLTFEQYAEPLRRLAEWSTQTP